MKNLHNIKQQILNDKKVANAVEYLLSKVVLDKKLPQLKFFYKKHKIILNKNGLFSIYKPNGQKLCNHIHYQEVAKYIIDNIDNIGNIEYIKYIENELFRFKDKIIFFTLYNQNKNLDIIDNKLQPIYDNYYKYKNTLLNLLKNN